MELLGIWLGTFITSFGMDALNGLRIFKDAADAGYKIDIDRISEITESLDPNASKIKFLKLLLPIFNIMHVSQEILEYNNLRFMVLDMLYALNALEEMTDEEQTEYLKKPTVLNAIFVQFKSEIFNELKDEEVEVESLKDDVEDSSEVVDEQIDDLKRVKEEQNKVRKRKGVLGN